MTAANTADDCIEGANKRESAGSGIGSVQKEVTLKFPESVTIVSYCHQIVSRLRLIQREMSY